MFGLNQLPWYRAADRKLRTVRPLMLAMLVLIIVISTYLLFFGDNVQRTGWVVYMWMP